MEANSDHLWRLLARFELGGRPWEAVVSGVSLGPDRARKDLAGGLESLVEALEALEALQRPLALEEARGCGGRAGGPGRLALDQDCWVSAP